MKTMDDFKSAHKGRIYILKTHDSTLLSFDGLDDLKRYVFADPDAKKALYRELNQLFLDDTEEVEAIERDLYQKADLSSLATVVSGGNFILLDVDHLNEDKWQHFNNQDSYIYKQWRQDSKAYQTIAQLLEEPNK